MLNFEQYSAADTADVAGVHIPVADLPGLTAVELNGTPAGASKALLSLLNQMYSVMSPTSFDKLGFSVAKANPVGAGSDLINQNYSLTNQFMVSHNDGTVEQLPVPTSGTNSGVGAIALTDLFPGASAKAATDATIAGILIPATSIQAYGGPSVPSADAREWLGALYRYLIAEAEQRNATTASAVVAKTIGSATGFTPPTDFTVSTNPTTDILAADLLKKSFFSVTYSITLQLLLSQATQQFDVNHVTS